jgi:hypothetical protein
MRIDRAAVRATFKLLSAVLIQMHELCMTDLMDGIAPQRRDQPTADHHEVVAICLTTKS